MSMSDSFTLRNETVGGLVLVFFCVVGNRAYKKKNTHTESLTYIGAISGKTGEMPQKILLSSQISFSWQQVRYFVIMKEHILVFSLFSWLIADKCLS